MGLSACGHLAVPTCSFSWVALACVLQLSAGAAIRRALCGREAQLTKPVFQRPALIRCSAGLQCRCASVRWPLAGPAAFAAADAAMPCHASLLQLSQQAPAGAAAPCVWPPPERAPRTPSPLLLGCRAQGHREPGATCCPVLPDLHAQELRKGPNKSKTS